MMRVQAGWWVWFLALARVFSFCRHARINCWTPSGSSSVWVLGCAVAIHEGDQVLWTECVELYFLSPICSCGMMFTWAQCHLVFLFLCREKQMNQEHDHLKKQIQILTEDLNKHAAELMAVRREHTNKVLTLQTELSQITEEVRICLWPHFCRLCVRIGVRLQLAANLTCRRTELVSNFKHANCWLACNEQGSHMFSFLFVWRMYLR